MIKRIVEVSNPSYLHLKNKQLLIEQNHEVVAQIPIEDIGVLVLEHSAINITQPLIIECQKNNTAIIFCDEKHLPYSTILPIAEGNNLHQKILKQQINITEPVRKNLWKQIIQQKITNQANTLKQFDKPFMRLEKLANEVKSGDSTNCEGLAAQYYWKALLGKDFVRDQNAEGVNSVLNYGYSIIRATIARSIVASGLHPAIGLFHHNQYNGLCLADDLMEPFRPWVDSIAYQLYQDNEHIGIVKETKIPFLDLISKSVKFKNKQMPLMVSVHYLMADLKRNFAKESKRLIYPKKIMFGGLQTMWTIVLFDLPTDDIQMKRDYRYFRKFLLENGFTMMQYSVYMRHSSSEENAQVHINRVKIHLPADGEVRIIKITDKQFGRIEVFYGKKRQPTEKAPEQLSFF